MNATPFHVAFFVVLASGAATAADKDGWEVVSEGAIVVKNRPRPNSGVTEVWVEGEIAAPVKDIQDAVTKIENFKNFMPHLLEARNLGPPEPDGSQHMYTRLSFPVVSQRDYILRGWVVKSTAPDGSGEFENRWTAVPTRLPERSGVVRIKVNDGGWYVRPKPGDKTKSLVTYKFAIDPGGWIPAFAAKMGNQQGVTETFEAVEKEAQRRWKARTQDAGKPAAEPPAGGSVPAAASNDAGAAPAP